MEAFATRFLALQDEADAPEETALRWFLWNLTDDGRTTFAHRLERRLGAPSDAQSMEEQLQELPLRDVLGMA